jgi:hypothetical protein
MDGQEAVGGVHDDGQCFANNEYDVYVDENFTAHLNL